MNLIVGLGNPGERYRFTRHNIGFQVLEFLAVEWSIPINREKMGACWGRGSFENNDVILLKPNTFMNLSGEVVSRFVRYFRINIEDMMVVYDDIDLEFGTTRIREGGGSGGHKGVQSIIEKLGDNKFIRIRMGVDRPEKTYDVSNYVLGVFDQHQRGAVKSYINQAAEAIKTVVSEGMVVAMNRFNRKVKLTELN